MLEKLEKLNPEMDVFITVAPDYEVLYDSMDRIDMNVGSEITGPHFVYGEGGPWYTTCPNEVIEEACEDSDHTPDEYTIRDVLIINTVR
jgi:hypothetical protein